MHKDFLELVGASGDQFVGQDEIEKGSFSWRGREIRIDRGVPIFYEQPEHAVSDQDKTNITFSAKWNRYMRGDDEDYEKMAFEFLTKRLSGLGVRSLDELNSTNSIGS